MVKKKRVNAQWLDWRSSLILLKNTEFIVLLLIGVLFLFFRAYGLETKSIFGIDQVTNGWAAKSILVDGDWPLVGMIAKGNTGFYIGPFYYYFVAFFYKLTNLDPIAAPLISLATSLISIGFIYFIVKRIFNKWVAIIAVFIHSVSAFTIQFDRIQWPVAFIPVVSLIIFYCLYQISQKKENYIIPLCITFGFSFHIHFTSVFYIAFILLALPFFPFTKKALIHIAVGLFLLVLFFIPTYISEQQSKGSQVKHFDSFLESNYHGIHLRRIMQLMGDAFIQFEGYLTFKFLKPLKYLLIPLFVFLLLKKVRTRREIVLSYLVIIWFAVPWFIFSTYKGELTDYYFSVTLPICLMIVSYLLYRLFAIKKSKIMIGLGLLFAGLYLAINSQRFFKQSAWGIEYYKNIVFDRVEREGVIPFQEGTTESFFYYVFFEYKK